MLSFQQACPSCQRSLQLPVEAKGQLAVCPACETQFVAAETSRANAVDQGVASAKNEAPTQYQSVTIEAVLAEAQAVFSTRQLPFLVPFLLPGIFLLIGFIGPIAYLSELGATNQNLALKMLVGFAPVLLMPVAYAFWVALNLANRILDHQPKDFGRDVAGEDSAHEPAGCDQQHWAKPQFRRFAAVYAVVLFSCVLMCALVVVVVMLMNLAWSIRAPEVRFVVIALTFIVGLVAFVGTMMRFWPMFPLSMLPVTRRDLVRGSWRVSGANLMTSFFLVTMVCVMLGLGTSFFGLGLPIVIPYAAMLITVGYRMICKVPIRAMQNRS